MTGSHEVKWTQVAVRDLQSIVDFLVEENPVAALRLAERIEKRAESLVSMPARGRVVPELRKLDILTYREIIVSPYRILYRIEEQTVLVLAVFDGRRALETILLSRIIATP